MLTVILVAAAIAAIIVFILKQQAPAQQQQQPVVIVKEQRAPTTPTIINPDPRFSPLPPEQSYSVPPDVRGQPLPAGLGAFAVNATTRGYPGAFQQMGVLTAPGGTETSASPNRTILPLFGRSIDPNRNRWNYYTRTDGINPIQLPLQYKRRNCDDDNGCDEINEGDSVGVPVLGQSYNATIYRYSTPRYLPVI
jgi:hypothetical protein